MLLGRSFSVSSFTFFAFLVSGLVADVGKEKAFDEFAHTGGAPGPMAVGEEPMEKKVRIDINKDNLHLLKDSPNYISLFQTDSCYHCKDLTAQLENTILKSKTKNKFFSVDCDKEKEICESYGVKEYPVILGRHNHSTVKYNKGSFDEEDLLTFDTVVARPPYEVIQDSKDLEALIKNRSDGFYLLFTNKDDVADINFSVVIKSFMSETIRSYASYDSKLAKKFSFAFPSLHYFPKDSEKPYTFKEKFEERKAISRFIFYMNSEFVSDIDQVNYQDLKDNEVSVSFYLYSDQTKLESFKGKCLSLEKIYKPVVFACCIDSRIHQQYFVILDVPKGTEQALVFHKLSDNTKYPYSGDFSLQSIETFFKDFSEGKLKPTFKSEPIPKNDTALVKTVVFDNFEKEVLNNEKSVFLLNAFPSCKICDKFVITFEGLAEKLKGVEGLVLRKINGIANDIPASANIRLEYFPTLYLYRNGKKDSPVFFSKSKTKENLINFLKENCKDLNIPDISAEEKEVEKAKVKKEKEVRKRQKIWKRNFK